ncbi:MULTISPECIES: hypothetical protein [Rhodococcus]|uniref:hypothetical protein n=1 Tax=Rhodococcus TaxID=1827 RepID=UPI00040174D6|nr:MULTISPECIES: hypothetical protein [Rhodococcus]MDJ0015534.1 hypothetical protein [Rhodococcus erythropolis]
MCVDVDVNVKNCGILAAVLVGSVAKMGEKKIVSRITRGAGDMVCPAIVVVVIGAAAVFE